MRTLVISRVRARPPNFCYLPGVREHPKGRYIYAVHNHIRKDKLDHHQC